MSTSISLAVASVAISCFSVSALLPRGSQPGQFLAERTQLDERTELCSESMRTWPYCSQAPWRKHRKASNQEICIPEGKSLPKLYVLGAQKTSTSSFGNDLACAGVVPVPSRGGNMKEFSYFVGRSKWTGAHKERAAWLSALPDCSPEEPRMIADMTPNNLRTVHGETPYGSAKKLELPHILSVFYGEHLKKITLVAIIREPLSRMQSAWYAARQCSNHAICTQDCKGKTFQADLRTAVANANATTPLYTEWLWTSMYGRHLKEWGMYIDPSQLYVIPYKQYTSGNADNICRDISQRTGFQMDCESNGREPSHSWKSEHASLDEDMKNHNNLHKHFKELMDPETDNLVSVLARGHKRGMGLANYDGTIGDELQIRDWLKASW